MSTFREGDFRYRVPLANGTYRVALTFVEPAAAGERVFDVLANGRRVIEKLDVAAAVGGALLAVTREFEASVTDDTLVLEFLPTRGRAIVSAIEIEASR